MLSVQLLKEYNTYTCSYLFMFLGPNSIVSLGIASSDIADEVHPGNWNGSVGYRNTGKCISSHHDGGNTDGEIFGVGKIEMCKHSSCIL